MPQAPPAPPAEDWQQKFSTLQGKYNADIGAANRAARAAETRVSQLEALIASMQSAPPPTANGHAAAPAKNITQEDIEAWGEELPQAARRWAQDAVETATRPLLLKIQQLEAQTTAVQGNTVESYLDVHCPEWRTINTSVAFNEWLNVLDDLTGVSRRDLLNDAYQKGAAQRTLAVFQRFLGDGGQTVATPAPPPTPHTPTPPAPSGQGTGRPSLGAFAAPGVGNSGGSDGASPAGAKTFTTREIAKFYDDVRSGLYRGREADKLRFEAEIIAAASGGRIIGA